MRLDEVRAKYLKFFQERDHRVIQSFKLVPENDPTTLFISSGMQPLIPYLLGEKHPSGNRLVNSQKCFRADDIGEVGDNRHTTFFEMLGNWSLGDYFKREQIVWLWEFLTKEIGLSPERLYVTAFAGDEANSIPRDTESVELWRELFSIAGLQAKEVELLTEKRAAEIGMQNGRIFYYDSKKNWWSRSGVPENMPAGELGGPDTELFFEFVDVVHDKKFGNFCHPNCDCGRFVEISNSVFMEYRKLSDGSFERLKQRNVDFGGGLERIVAASLSNPDVFGVDVFKDIIGALERLSGRSYEASENKESMRVVADHLRAVVFLIGDGVMFSNKDSGYILRRLLRRAVRFSDRLGLPVLSLSKLADGVVASYEGVYPELSTKRDAIISLIIGEEEKFRNTLRKGLKEFDRFISGGKLSGKDAFVLFSTYGFPVEITEEMALERGVAFDLSDYKQEFEKHQGVSRSGSEQKFKGGLADHSEISVKYHTATHMLHVALRTVLGEHVLQRGSNITKDRLRFDFSHPAKLTDEQKMAVEGLINKRISDDLPVSFEIVSLDKARAMNALGVFGDKYDDEVKVYTIGDKNSGIFSIEICGGPHVERTGSMGHFRIIKEEAVAVGVRRIKAILE